jgi:hypothetical protein
LEQRGVEVSGVEDDQSHMFILANEKGAPALLQAPQGTG